MGAFHDLNHVQSKLSELEKNASHLALLIPEPAKYSFLLQLKMELTVPAILAQTGLELVAALAAGVAAGELCELCELFSAQRKMGVI